MLALYGHPFSSYTWKAQIALYANAIRFEFRVVDPDHPEHAAVVAAASPQGKFPLLLDSERQVFEATCIIEYLDLNYPGPQRFIPADPSAALDERMLDRAFDNYVMSPTQEFVAAYIRSPQSPDPTVLERSREGLERSYRWLDRWLVRAGRGERLGLVECAAAPALFYADWVCPIPAELGRLREWRALLLGLAPVARCVDAARPFRAYFPPGAPDRD